MYDILGADEHVIMEKQFAPDICLFWLKAKYKPTSKRIIHSAPNTILGLIPSGRRERSLPLNNISSVMTTYEFDVGRFAVGCFLLIVGLAVAASNLIGLPVFVVGFILTLSPNRTSFAFVNNAGQPTTDTISNLELGNIRDFAAEVNKVIVDLK